MPNDATSVPPDPNEIAPDPKFVNDFRYVVRKWLKGWGVATGVTTLVALLGALVAIYHFAEAAAVVDLEHNTKTLTDGLLSSALDNYKRATTQQSALDTAIESQKAQLARFKMETERTQLQLEAEKKLLTDLEAIKGPDLQKTLKPLRDFLESPDSAAVKKVLLAEADLNALRNDVKDRLLSIETGDVNTSSDNKILKYQGDSREVEEQSKDGWTPDSQNRHIRIAVHFKTPFQSTPKVLTGINLIRYGGVTDASHQWIAAHAEDPGKEGFTLVLDASLNSEYINLRGTWIAFGQ